MSNFPVPPPFTTVESPAQPSRPVPPPLTPSSPFADELHPDFCTATDARGCGICGGTVTEITATLAGNDHDITPQVWVAAAMNSATGQPGVDMTAISALSETSTFLTLDETDALIASLIAARRVAGAPTVRTTRPAVAR